MGFRSEVWDELEPKGKACLVLLLPLAVAGVALVAHHSLADKGCAAVVGFWKHVDIGVQALVIGLFLAGAAAGLLRALVGIPEIAEAAKEKLEQRSARRADEIERYGHIVTKADWKPALAILAICLAGIAVIILLGSGIGYIAWLFSC